MSALKVGDKVYVTNHRSDNYEKVGIITRIDSRGILVKAINGDMFYTVDCSLLEEVLFTKNNIGWLSLVIENNVIKFPTKCKSTLSLEEIAQKNKENQERIKKERAKDNRSVMRSHNLHLKG